MQCHHQASQRFVLATAFMAVGMLWPLRAAFEFTAYLRVGEREFFVVTDLDDGTSFGWRELGDQVRGERIARFDAGQNALVLENERGSMALPLRNSAVPPAIDEPIAATIVRHGVLRSFAIDEQHVTVDQLGQPVRGIINPWFGAPTTNIPLTLGVCFGFTADLAGLPKISPIELEYRFHTPRIVRPDGSTFRTNSMKAIATSDLQGRLQDQGAFYRLDYDYELVPGTYRAEIVYQGRVLAAKEFVVGAAADAVPPPIVVRGGIRPAQLRTPPAD